MLLSGPELTEGRAFLGPGRPSLYQSSDAATGACDGGST
jgi:hypothetical protein